MTPRGTVATLALLSSIAFAGEHTQQENLDFENTKNFSIDVVHTEVELKVSENTSGKLTFVQNVKRGGENCKAQLSSEKSAETLRVNMTMPRTGLFQNCRVERSLVIEIPKTYAHTLDLALRHGKLTTDAMSLQKASLKFEHSSFASLSPLKATHLSLDFTHSDMSAQNIESSIALLKGRHSKFNLSNANLGETTSDLGHSELHWTGAAKTLDLRMEHNLGKILLGTVERVDIKTSHADIELTTQAPFISYESQHGDLAFHLKGVSHPKIKGKSSHSDVRVALEESALFEYELLGSHTDLASNFPVSHEKKRVMIRGTNGTGQEKGDISLDGSHGSITIEKL